MDQSDRLQRRYEREKKARLQAEELLETKSRELFSSNRKLQQISEELEQLVFQRTKQLVEARDEALASAKIKSEFLANMSHEIRTPMNGVLGTLHALEHCEDSNKRQKLVKTAKDSGALLISIINDILELSKIESVGIQLEEEHIDLTEVVEATLLNFAASAQKKMLNLVSDISFRTPRLVVGDGNRLKQVLGNFINNAIKFTDTGDVTVSLIPSSSGACRLSVTDTGIGMSEEQTQEIFKAFSQADTSTTRKYGGTGLGLCIASKIVSAFGSDIEVKSSPAEGSCFAFELKLPIADSNTLADEFIHDSNVNSVSIVSQCDSRRRVMTTRLNELGFNQVYDAVTLEGIDIANDDSKKILFIDLFEAGKAVATTCLKLKKQHGDKLKIIHVAPFGYENKIPSHIDARIFKPLQQDELIAALTGKERESIYAPNTSMEYYFYGKKLLVADDNEVNLEVAREIFSPMGFEIEVATNGREAVAASKKQQFDLILMDVQMPVMDGLEAVKEIRKLPGYPVELPIFAMTAHALAEDHVKSKNAGMNEHITKPIEPDLLAPKIAEYLHTSKKDTEDKDTQKTKIKESNKLVDENNIHAGITGIDFDSAIKRLRGKKEKYYSLLIDFCERFSSADHTMDNYMRDGCFEEMRDLAHKLKGSGGSLGLELLFESSSKLERYLKTDLTAPPHNLLDDFKYAISTMNTDIDKLKHRLDKDKAKTSTKTVGTDEIKAILTDILKHISTDLGKAVSSLDRLNELTTGSQYQEIYTSVSLPFKSFKIEEAKDKIEFFLSKDDF